MFTSAAYLIYIAISAIVTVLVSRTLSKNGQTYLIDGFNGNEILAKSVNHMLVVGFYLLNLGFVLLRMKTNVLIDSIEGLIVYLSSGIGFVLFALGIAHFFNMWVIHKFRQGQIERNRVELLRQVEHV
jgi:hypothetical protein